MVEVNYLKCLDSTRPDGQRQEALLFVFEPSPLPQSTSVPPHMLLTFMLFLPRASRSFLAPNLSLPLNSPRAPVTPNSRLDAFSQPTTTDKGARNILSTIAQPNMAVTGIKVGYPRYAGNTEKQQQWYYHTRGLWREWGHKLNDLERQT